MSEQQPPQPPSESGGKPPRRDPIVIIGKDGIRRGIATTDGSLDYTKGIDTPHGNLSIIPPTDGSETNN